VRAVRSEAFPRGPSSRLLATARFARDPFGYFAECRRRYGDPFTLPLLGSKVVVTGRVDLVKQIFAMPPRSVGGLLGHLIPEILGPTSVLVLSGAQHSDDRKLLMPMFHGERIAAWTGIIADVTRAALGALEPGARLTGYELGRAIALDVILRALFGVDDDRRVEAFRRAVLDLHAAGSPPLIFVRALRRSIAGLGPWARVERRLAALDRLFHDEIAARRRRGPGPDLLWMLLEARYEDGRAMTDRQLRDQLMSLALAGHETMAVTFAWALHWIGTLPDVRRRLEDGDEAYLDAVCKETLRIYPIQPIVMRHLLTDAELAGRRLPAGGFVGAATTLVHMDPDLYPEPERFWPDRFLGKSYGTAEYFPFGGGARRCIGANMALAELKIVLGTIVREFRLRCVDPATPPPARQSTVTGPRGGVPLVYCGTRTDRPLERAT